MRSGTASDPVTLAIERRAPDPSLYTVSAVLTWLGVRPVWPFKKRSSAAAVAAAPSLSHYTGPGSAGADSTGAALQPRCSRCARALESRLPPANSMLRPTYAAVVCRLCSWVDCKDCKGSPSDAPCTICGSPVTPAQLAFFE